MVKISLDGPGNNQAGSSLPIKRARKQPLNDAVGPSQVISDNGQDDDGGPPPKRKHPSRTAIADEVLDRSSPLKKTPARPRRQAPKTQNGFEGGNQVDPSMSKNPKTTSKNIPIPQSSRKRPAVTPTAASARSSRRTGPTPPIFGDPIPKSERSASPKTAIRLESSPRSPENIIKPDLAASAKTTSKLKSETSNQSSDKDSYISIYGGGDGSSSGRSYWLMKAEPESRFEKGVDVKFSIDDLKNAKEPEPWDGEYEKIFSLISFSVLKASRFFIFFDKAVFLALFPYYFSLLMDNCLI